MYCQQDNSAVQLEAKDAVWKELAPENTIWADPGREVDLDFEKSWEVRVMEEEIGSCSSCEEMITVGI